MKKIYMLLAGFVFSLGVMTAQSNTSQSQGNLETVGSKSEKTTFIAKESNGKTTTARKLVTDSEKPTGLDPSVNGKSNSSNGKQILSGKVIIITKEDWAKHTERSKEYILAHPEKYSIEQ